MWRLVLLLPFVVLFGCGGVSEKDLIGTWTGKAGMTYEAMQKEASEEGEQASFLAEQETNDRTITLELMEGGKATFNYPRPLDATWSLSNDTLTLVLPTRESPSGGSTFSGTYSFKVNSAKSISGDDPNVKGFTLKFEK